MNEKHYQYVSAVAQEQSFSKAAKRLYISQPSLSQCINRVEETFGVPLFERTRSGVTLTPAGEIYLARGKNILELEEQILCHARETALLQHGNLQLGIAPYRDDTFLAPVLKRFHQQYPGIHILLHEMRQGEIENAVFDGKLDLAVAMEPHRSQDLSFTRLFGDRLLVAIAKDHWYFQVNDVTCTETDEAYPKIHLADLAQCNFILLSTHKELHAFEDELCHRAGFTPKVVLETKGVESVHAMAAAGLGAVFLPESFLRHSKVRKDLAYFLPDVPAPAIDIGLLKSKRQPLSAPAQKLEQALMEELLCEEVHDR